MLVRQIIPLMIRRERTIELLKRIKKVILIHYNIFNPGKLWMPSYGRESLLYEITERNRKISHFMDFSISEGILKAAEKCKRTGL